MSWCDLPVIMATLLVAVAMIRVVATYHVLSQAADEPATIAAGMEWLDKGTYMVDSLHPPLARVASALGPFLEGLRYPPGPTLEQGPDLAVFFKAGDDILHAGRDYWRTLAVARLGMFPFFAFGGVIVFLWARELAGGLAAVLAVLFFTTLPPILAFTGFAYTDMPVGVLVAGSAFAFAHWLSRPTPRTSILFGVITALALLSKFTALLFLPTCWLAVACCWLGFGPKEQRDWRVLFRRALWAGLAFAVVFWGGYRFSFGPLRSVFARPAHDIEALHAPAPLKHALLGALDVPVPAPALFKGLAWNFLFNVQGRPSYLLGNIRHTGWWYFFIVAIGVKTPLACLLLALFGGATSAVDAARKPDWRLAVPCACALAIVLSTMPVKVNYGVRHILCVYPFLSIVAGYGAARLWQTQEVPPSVARVALALFLAWHLVSGARVHPDYVTYFNELAGQHPEKVLLWGCDYDCGQDIARLVNLTKEHHIDHLALAVFGNNDFAQQGLPSFEKLAPYQRTTGWVAASIRELETGDTFGGGSARDGYQWLTSCEPVARAGKTIYLYYLPCQTADHSKARSIWAR